MVHRINSRLAAFALGATCASASTWAAETAQFINAPAPAKAPAATLAAQFEFKLVLREGKGLARQLLDAGVEEEDAAAAARLAAGHLGDGSGACFAKVSIVRSTLTSAFSLVRATIMTDSDRTVIERRDGKLVVSSQVATSKFPKLV